ncbi:helix-turn-helix domain-containing protein [Limosilactobacillus fermentum]|uniref:helix-turn-helix domain-containing protein n=1 Tax=Limosilactobacillus fermentum TaxID=1613 RepID=UPI00070D531A|nr:helix-turn-helix domain-containing protein [Limosilactobacillus fermentum]PHI33434.1 helix-turn-helix domain containing protein [Limosilactobacillus fermentum]
MSHILTLSDRTVIQTLLKVGYSQKQIAEEVGVAPSTINYELKRCPKGSMTLIKLRKTAKRS